MSTTLLENRPADSANAAADPLRVMFITTTLEVGGAETLLVSCWPRKCRCSIICWPANTICACSAA
jgi:hypothetical protein